MTRIARSGRGAAAVLLAVALATSGCGADDPEPSASPSPAEGSSEPASEAPTRQEDPDLCGLLTAEDFETVTGEAAVGEPEYDEPVGAMRGTCTWAAAAGFPIVMLGAYNATDREATLSLVDDSEPVEGLGTEADWSDTAGLLVVIEDADWYLQVLATGDGAGYDLTRSTEVAELALGRL